MIEGCKLRVAEEVSRILGKYQVSSLLVGYSGGVDSHVLLHSLAMLRAQQPTLKLSAIHVNHGVNLKANQWQKHCEQICGALEIELIIKKSYLKILINKIKRKGRITAIDFFMQSSWVLRKYWWKTLNLFYKKGKRSFLTDKRKILFFSAEPWTTTIKKDGTIKKGNPYHDPIVEELNKNRKNSTIVIDTTFTFPSYKEIIKSLKEKMLDKEINYELLENYIDRDTKKTIKKRTRYFKSRWNSIKKQTAFINSFDYNGFNIFNLVEKQFSTYFSFRLKGHLMELETIKKIIAEKRPDVAVITDETRVFGRALFYVCKENKIKTVAIQHGNLRGTIRCTHTSNEISDKTDPNHCPIPNKTAVFGLKDREFLIKNVYPANTIVITGSQRYDILAYVDKIYNKGEICKKLNLDPSKKIIVFTSQPLPKEENIRVLTVILKTIKRFPDLKLVIKVHPSENKKFYEKIVKKMRSDAIIIKNIPTLNMLTFGNIILIRKEKT